MVNSGTASLPPHEDPRSSSAARTALRGLIAKAIREYPRTGPREAAWSYGPEDPGFEALVQGLTDHVMAVITGSAR